MLKRVLSIVLAIVFVAGVLCFTGCGEETPETEERLPVTLSVLGITDGSTTPEAVKAVEDEINRIMGMMYSTHIDLTLVTVDEYEELVAERVALAKYNDKLDKAVQDYNSKAVSNANSAAIKKTIGKWKFVVSNVEATTVTTREKYTSIITELNEKGILEVVYPEAASPIDVVMIIGENMYRAFDEAGVTKSIKSELNTEAYTKFSQFIYPTYLELLQAITGDIKAIPGNNLLAEYTYLVVNKELADKYDFDVEAVDNYDDLAGFLASVKAGENVTPMNTVPDPLGIFKIFEDDTIAIGTYCDPIIGYNKEEKTSYSVNNLYDIPEYQAYLKLMDEYKKAGYFEAKGSTSAVNIIKGDASIEKLYGEENYIKILQNPIVEENSIFKGMLGVSEYTSNSTRALEFILELTTNPELKNVFQYGIEGTHYVTNGDGTITRLNHDYMMDNHATGNAYKGYPEEGMLPDQWEYVKQTNLDSILNPYLSYYKTETGGYSPLYYVNDVTLDGLLGQAIQRAVLNEAFKEVDPEHSYDYYLENSGGTAGKRVAKAVKENPKYKEYFIQQIMLDNDKLTQAQAESLYKADSGASGAKYNYDWFFNKIVALETDRIYGNLKTATGLDNAIKAKVAEYAGATRENFDKAVEKANTYYSNIKTLRIMTRLVIWDELTDEEWAEYEAMGPEEFENAVYTYVKTHYDEENNVDEEKYDLLVKAFIASQLKLTDPSDNSSYTISWDEYQEAKEKAQKFFGVIDELKDEYGDELSSYYGPMYSFYEDREIPTLIHDMLYSQWLKENEYKKSEFETEQYNEILEFLGITYTQFMQCRRTDTTKFTDYMTKIKNQYKSILVDNFSLAQFKNDNITNDDVLSTLLKHKIEEKTGINDEIVGRLGISYDRYKSEYDEMSKFITMANQMRTKFIYTLLTQYSQSEIDAFDYNDIDSIVYEVVANSGFYTNQLCTYICTDLSTYMNKKSDIKTYKTYVTTIANALSKEINSLSMTVQDVVNMDIDDAIALITSIVTEKDFSEVINIEEKLSNVSGPFIKDNYTASDINAHIQNAINAINGDSLYKAIIYFLSENLKEAIAAQEV